MGNKYRKRSMVLIIAAVIALILGFVPGYIIGANGRDGDKQPLPKAAMLTGQSADNAQDTIYADSTGLYSADSSIPDDANSAVLAGVDDGDGDGVGDEAQQASEGPQEIGPQSAETIVQEDSWVDNSRVVDVELFPPDSIRQIVHLDVPSYNQIDLGYPLGCELVALAMMMNYEYNVDIYDLYMDLPRADLPYEGFRGDPATSTSGWTIFPSALSGMMIKYIGSSYDMSNLEMEDLKEQLNTDTPILVWIKGLGWPVHALCLTGYDEFGFLYNDPATGEKDAHISYADFYEIWNEPIIDRVLGLTYTPRKALSYIRE